VYNESPDGAFSEVLPILPPFDAPGEVLTMKEPGQSVHALVGTTLAEDHRTVMIPIGIGKNVGTRSLDYNGVGDPIGPTAAAQ